MYALNSIEGKAKGKTLRAQSILVQGHAYTSTPWPHPPDTVTQQHHLVSTQLVCQSPSCLHTVSRSRREHHTLSCHISPLAHCLPLSRWTVQLIGREQWFTEQSFPSLSAAAQASCHNTPLNSQCLAIDYSPQRWRNQCGGC